MRHWTQFFSKNDHNNDQLTVSNTKKKHNAMYALEFQITSTQFVHS